MWEYMKYKSKQRVSKSAIVIALVFSCLLTSSKAFIVEDNSHLFSEEAQAMDNVLKKIKLDRTSISLSYKYQNAGQIHCEDTKTFISTSTTISQLGEIPLNSKEPKYQIATKCSFRAGSIEEKKEKIYGNGIIYRLKDGKSIISIKSKTAKLEDIVYEVEYEDLATLAPKRSKLVSQKGLYSKGIKLDNQTVHFINHTGDYGAELYKIAGVNTYSKTSNIVNPQEGGLLSIKVFTRARFILKEDLNQ